MQIANPLQMNDWEFKRFIRVIFVFQLCSWGIEGWYLVGLRPPGIAQAIMLVYLLFIPGIVILRALRLHKLGTIETLIFAVALSTAFVMLVGLLMNAVGPLLGIEDPISPVTCVTVGNVAVLVLTYVAYLRDNDYSAPAYLRVRSILTPKVIVLGMFVVIAVVGTAVFNLQQNNIVSAISMMLVASTIVVFGFFEPNRKELYPCAIMAVAVSMLLMSSMNSAYLVGWDIEHEYYLARTVDAGSSWDPSTPYAVNGMLSIVILAPFLAKSSAVSIVMLFKIVYPLLFSLVPLGLYCLLKRSTNDRTAFFSVFFFVSIYTFYSEMTQLPRQEIAEMFLIAILLLFSNKRIMGAEKTIIYLLLSFSLIVSHYGLAFIFLGLLIFVWTSLRVLHWYSGKDEHHTVSFRLVSLFAILTLTWYTYVASSSTMIYAAVITRRIGDAVFTDLLSSRSSEGLALITGSTASPLHSLAKSMYLFTELLIVVGFAVVLLKRYQTRFSREAVAFGAGALVIMLAGIILPYFASSINTSRLYHIGLVFLCPFFTIGWLATSRAISRLRMSGLRISIGRSTMRVAGTFLAVFFLFNCGLIWEAIGDNPKTYTLDSAMDFPRFDVQEISSAEWLFEVKETSADVYADSHRFLLIGGFDWKVVQLLQYDVNSTPIDSYIFLGKINVVRQVVLVERSQEILAPLSYVNTSSLLVKRSMIYDNGWSEIAY